MLFTPRLDILPASQRTLWDELSATPAHFTLYGGTALALHLGHRQSVDFDFFSLNNINPIKLRDTVPYLAGAETMLVEENTLICSVNRGEPVKVSFFGLPNIHRIQPPLVASDNKLNVASLMDIAGTKAQVVQARNSAKDYFDIDALITMAGLSLGKQLTAGQLVYGPAYEPLLTLKALSYFDDVKGLSSEVKQRLLAAVAATNADALPISNMMEPA